MKKILIFPFFLSSVSFASTYTFDPSLIDGKIGNSMILKEGYFPAGKYLVTIELNGNTVNSSDIVFSDSDSGSLTPCLTERDLSALGVKPSFYNGRFVNGCLDISKTKEMSFSFDFYSRVLSLFIPDKYINAGNDGIAPEAVWDDGVNALLLNYQAVFNESKSRFNGLSQGSQYIQLSPSLNIGPWRLRNFSSWNKSGSAKGDWSSAYTYAERTVNSIKSKFIIGENYTKSDVFDSVPFNGVMLSSDETMIPISQREFTPIVRGIANSVSTVEILQNGYVISKKNVPAGNFEITDLPYTGGGDLNVIVTGSNGEKQFFTVPNTAPALALHEGYLKYSFMYGVHRSDNRKQISQLSVMYGFPANITGFGGYQYSSDYKSIAAGVGTMLGDFGAVSASVIRANSSGINHASKNYNSFIFRYNKGFESGTYVTMSARRNGMDGFIDLDSALNNPMLQEENVSEKSRYSLSVGQNLWGGASLSVNGDLSEYRDGKERGLSYGATFNTLIFDDISLGIGTSKNNIIQQSGDERNDELYNLWVSIPFGDNSYSASYQMSKNNGALSSEVGVSGKAISNQLYWDFRAGHASGEGRQSSSDSSGSVFLNYAGRSGTIFGNYSRSNDHTLYGGGVSGSVVLYKNGVVMGQQQGNTVAIIDANNIDNASVGSWPGVTTDYSGKAIYGYLTPYVENMVSINPVTIKNGANIKINTLKVVPTEGAIVMAKFNAHTGKSLLIKLKNRDGSLIPFGSVVVVNKSEDADPVTGIVNDNGTSYLAGVPAVGVINVIYGKDKSCEVNYSTDNVKPHHGIYTIDAVCK